jgi:peroxiredoxin
MFLSMTPNSILKVAAKRIPIKTQLIMSGKLKLFVKQAHLSIRLRNDISSIIYAKSKELIMNKLALILVVLAFLASCASSGPSPEVGDTAPDFNLVDVSGNEVHLSDLKGKKKVVLIFYSLYQSPISGARNDCRDQLQDVQNQIDKIRELNAEVIAISSMGDQKDVSRMKADFGITFTLIPKPNRKVAEDFGVWNRSGNYATATIIIDQKGRIRYKEVYKSLIGWAWYGGRISVSEIIRQLQGI